MTTNTATKPAAVSVTIGDEGRCLDLRFGNGDREIVYVGELSDDILRYATAHGLKQKLVDAAAIPRNTETGRSATLEEKMAAVLEVLETLRGGNWNKIRTTGEGSGHGGLLFRALVRMQAGKMTPEAVKAWLDGKDKKAQAELRANPRVAAVIAEIKAEGVKSQSAGDDLLADLESME